MRRLAVSIALLAVLAQPAAARAQECGTYRITGYVRGAGNPWTYDGTSVWTRERIAAASWNVPIDAYVQVIGLGTYRTADRGGGLGAGPGVRAGRWTDGHIDILVNTYSEALALTGFREVCVYA